MRVVLATEIEFRRADGNFITSVLTHGKSNDDYDGSFSAGSRSIGETARKTGRSRADCQHSTHRRLTLH